MHRVPVSFEHYVLNVYVLNRFIQTFSSNSTVCTKVENLSLWGANFMRSMSCVAFSKMAHFLSKWNIFKKNEWLFNKTDLLIFLLHWPLIKHFRSENMQSTVVFITVQPRNKVFSDFFLLLLWVNDIKDQKHDKSA